MIWRDVLSSCDVVCVCSGCCICVFFFFQAEDGIRDLVRSRGLGDVYKRQARWYAAESARGHGSPSAASWQEAATLLEASSLLLSLIHI